jgi:hypothetical protein
MEVVVDITSRSVYRRKGTPVSIKQEAVWAEEKSLDDLADRKISCNCRNSKAGLLASSLGTVPIPLSMDHYSCQYVR